MRVFPVLLALLLAACASPDAPPAPTPPPPAATTVYLVRHAEKVDDSDDPVLSEAGMARARALADSLEGADIDAIFVTPFQRTGLTAQPLAERVGITPVVVPVEGGTDSLTIRTARQIRALPPGSAALVVGHSNTVGALVEALGGPPTANLPDCEYNTLFEVTMADSVRFEAYTYGAASEGEECVMPPLDL